MKHSRRQFVYTLVGLGSVGIVGVPRTLSSDYEQVYPAVSYHPDLWQAINHMLDYRRENKQAQYLAFLGKTPAHTKFISESIAHIAHHCREEIPEFNRTNRILRWQNNAHCYLYNMSQDPGIANGLLFDAYWSYSGGDSYRSFISRQYKTSISWEQTA